MKESDDAGEMLAWLEAQLQAIEALGNAAKAAWIIGNVNPGSKYCNSKWARRYNILIERYQKLVRMQLFGHEPEEFFQLQYPHNGAANPFGVILQGGKATTLN
jgi:hypothetical protein